LKKAMRLITKEVGAEAADNVDSLLANENWRGRA
jgi:hypothetical protein